MRTEWALKLWEPRGYKFWDGKIPPNLYDIAHGFSIGVKSNSVHIWYPCPICTEPRWITLRDSEHNPQCIKCRWSRPDGYEVRDASELGYAGTGIFYKDRCPDCGKEIWRRKAYLGHCCSKCGNAKKSLKKLIPGYEAKRAWEVGLKGRYMVFLDKCPTCGKELWRGKKELGSYCLNCALKGIPKLKGERNPRWKGGRFKTKTGYISVRIYPDNPYYGMAQKGGRILEHRLVLAQKLGRLLKPWEIPNHKNTVRDDNHPDNLELTNRKGNNIYTRLTVRIKELEGRVTLLEAENVLLRRDNMGSLPTGEYEA